MQQIHRVVVVGGMHGNEFTGAYLIKKLERSPHLIQRSSFETLPLFGNPQAFQKVRRYIDIDLNRSFLRQDLDNTALTSYESQRAKAIDRQFGAAGETPVDVLLDLHTTTANMGQTLILANLHPFNLQLAAWLCAQNPQVRVLSWLNSGWQDASIKSLCTFSFSIEVGPVAQGILYADAVLQTEALLHQVLDYLEAYNQATLPNPTPPLTLYQYIKAIDYPRNDQGEIQAMIHPHLQFRDYQALNPGDPLFLTFDNQTICYEEEATVYPVFVNEAAYYEKGIALCLTQKQRIALS